MIVSFEGIQGTGKTTAAVALAYEESMRTGKLVYSNNHLNFENYRHFDTEVFVSKIVGNELENVILLTDEMYQMADSRASQTKLNILWTYFAVQTRKRGVDMYICTHNLDHIDLRLRRAVDIRGTCRYYPEKPCRKCRCKVCGGTGKLIMGNGQKITKDCPECNGVGGTGAYNGKPCDRCLGYGELGWVRVYFLDRRLRRRYTVTLFGPAYWHLFNTWERIPLQARLFKGIDTAEVI